MSSLQVSPICSSGTPTHTIRCKPGMAWFHLKYLHLVLHYLQLLHFILHITGVISTYPV